MAVPLHVTPLDRRSTLALLTKIDVRSEGLQELTKVSGDFYVCAARDASAATYQRDSVTLC